MAEMETDALHKIRMRSEEWSTSSGETSTGEYGDTRNGDSDDVISLCSWTTDQGDPVVTVPSHAPPYCFAPPMAPEGPINGNWHDGVAMAPDGVTSGNWHDGAMSGTAMPQGSWYMPTLMPTPETWYVVMPKYSMCNGNPHGRMPQQSANTWKSAQWQRPGTQQWKNWMEPDASGSRPRSHGERRPSSSKNYSGGKKTVASSSSETPEPTTLILRNLPLDSTRDTLLQMLDEEGFSGAYDFVHLPIDFQTKAGLGYALVNTVNHSEAQRMRQHFEGFSKWPYPCENICEVAWNNIQQGIGVHIDRYRNSPLMHESVPETYRPALFKNGLRIDFPAPTHRIRHPRIRHQKAGVANDQAASNAHEHNKSKTL